MPRGWAWLAAGPQGITLAELVFGVTHEGAADVDDLLDRRTRVGLIAEDKELARPLAERALARGERARLRLRVEVPGAQAHAGLCRHRRVRRLCSGMEVAAEDVEERGLSGAVRAHEAVALSRIQLERSVREERSVAERLLQIRNGYHAV